MIAKIHHIIADCVCRSSRHAIFSFFISIHPPYIYILTSPLRIPVVTYGHYYTPNTYTLNPLPLNKYTLNPLPLYMVYILTYGLYINIPFKDPCSDTYYQNVSTDPCSDMVIITTIIIIIYTTTQQYTLYC